tara:strand:- start:8448 stop:10163 length:1716 start_codon:yes stop_codon:yes gene_type:complete
MIKFQKHIILSIVFILGLVCNVLNAQNYIGSLNDSILKYKAAEYQKALDFGFLALDFFKDEDEMSLEFVNTNYYLGETYFYLGEYKTSFEYLSQTLELYDLLKPNQRRNKDVVKPPWVLIIMGNVFYQKKDYDNAERFYNEALENFKLFDANYNDEKFAGINTSLLNLSLVKRDQGDLKLAKELLDQLFKRVNNFKPTPTDLVRVYTSYMELYMFSGNKNLVVENFNKIKTIYESSLSITNLELESPLVFAIANRTYADFLESNGQVEESLEYLLFARNLVEDIPNEIPKVNSEISKTYFLLGMNDKAKNLIQKNLNYERINATQRLNNFKLLEKIYLSEQSTENLLRVKDSIIYYNEQPIIEQQEKEFNTLENLILISEKQDDLNKSQLRTNRIILISLISFSALILILLSLKFNFDLQKEKNTRLSLEKDLISEELKQKKRELFSKVNFISQRNDYLSKISDQIGQDFPESKKLKRQIKNITSSEKTYNEFDKMFSQVYPKFYKKLNAITKLSQTDIRLASYIRMNHTNNEISRISGISFRTVESQRYRLSKKLDLAKGQDLNSFIQNL